MTLKRSCTCGDLHPIGTRCPAGQARYQRRREQRRATPTERGYGPAWRKLSALVIARDAGRCRLRLPVCTHIATTADHIVAKANGGTDHPSNLQAACRPCNSSKRNR